MATTEHRPTERVLDILELLSNSEEGMTLTELAKALNAQKQHYTACSYDDCP